jgi:hypothetical protein
MASISIGHCSSQGYCTSPQDIVIKFAGTNLYVTGDYVNQNLFENPNEIMNVSATNVIYGKRDMIINNLKPKNAV